MKIKMFMGKFEFIYGNRGRKCKKIGIKDYVPLEENLYGIGVEINMKALDW